MFRDFFSLVSLDDKMFLHSASFGFFNIFQLISSCDTERAGDGKKNICGAQLVETK